jgi:hypothetical protein
MVKGGKSGPISFPFSPLFLKDWTVPISSAIVTTKLSVCEYNICVRHLYANATIPQIQIRTLLMAKILLFYFSCFLLDFSIKNLSLKSK